MLEGLLRGVGILLDEVHGLGGGLFIDFPDGELLNEIEFAVEAGFVGVLLSHVKGFKNISNVKILTFKNNLPNTN